MPYFTVQIGRCSIGRTRLPQYRGTVALHKSADIFNSGDFYTQRIGNLLQHSNSEIVLPAEPPAHFRRTLAHQLGKLLFAQPALRQGLLYLFCDYRLSA